MLNIPTQLHPQSLQLFELMCWCWSDKPQHRPTFGQILKIIKADSFTHLLDATPVTASSRKNQVTAACLKSASSSPPKLSTLTVPAINDDGFTMTYSTASKVLSPIEIWYGTKCGSCGVVCFHQSLTVKVCKSLLWCHLSLSHSHTHTHIYTVAYTRHVGTASLQYGYFFDVKAVVGHRLHPSTL